MEQGVAAAVRRAGLDFKEDVKIINLNPDEGLAAFLSGDGDAYIGGIPQRTRATKEGMIEMLTGSDIGPAPINGLVSTKSYVENNEEVILKLLEVWFKIVNYVNTNPDEAGNIIIDILNANSAGKITLADFKRFWNNYEHYPSSPLEIEKEILSPTGKNYWKLRWDDCNTYFYNTAKVINKPIESDDAFYMLKIQHKLIQ
jgi:hypothetical protein